MPLFIGIFVFGVARVSRAFTQLTLRPAIRRMVHPAIRAAAVRLRGKIAQAAPVLTGVLASKLRILPVKILDRFGVGRVEYATVLPEGEDEFVFALRVLEYGSPGSGNQPLRFFRDAVDDNAAEEVARISAELGKEFEREWARMFKK